MHLFLKKKLTARRSHIFCFTDVYEETSEEIVINTSVPTYLVSCLRPALLDNQDEYVTNSSLVDPELQALLLTYPAYVFKIFYEKERSTEAQEIFQKMYSKIQPVPGPEEPLKTVSGGAIDDYLSLAEILNGVLEENQTLHRVWENDSEYDFVSQNRTIRSTRTDKPEDTPLAKNPETPHEEVGEDDDLEDNASLATNALNNDDSDNSVSNKVSPAETRISKQELRKKISFRLCWLKTLLKDKMNAIDRDCLTDTSDKLKKQELQENIKIAHGFVSKFLKANDIIMSMELALHAWSTFRPQKKIVHFSFEIGLLGMLRFARINVMQACNEEQIAAYAQVFDNTFDLIVGNLEKMKIGENIVTINKTELWNPDSDYLFDIYKQIVDKNEDTTIAHLIDRTKNACQDPELEIGSVSLDIASETGCETSESEEESDTDTHQDSSASEGTDDIENGSHTGN
jgi:hypothetical protein